MPGHGFTAAAAVAVECGYWLLTRAKKAVVVDIVIGPRARWRVATDLDAGQANSTTNAGAAGRGAGSADDCRVAGLIAAGGDADRPVLARDPPPDGV